MNTKHRNNEAGLVSIMVTMIMILVISLIVIGFAQVTRRNQREALDRQLSTQAFYAAETGLNDAKAYIRANSTGFAKSASCTDFMTVAGLNSGTNPKQYLNTDHTVGYTCLTINNQPTSLKFANIANNAAVAAPLFSDAAHPFTYLTFSWDATNNALGNSNACSAGTSLPPASTATGGINPWACDYGLLRLDLVPDLAAAGDASTFGANTQTFFIKPSAGGSGTVNSPAFGSNQRGTLVSVQCNGGTCNAKVNLDVGTRSQYYARISAVYKDLINVTIAGNPGTSFRGAQAVVDSTGRAQDVLRRLQVRVNLLGSSLQPSAGLQTTGSICKLITVTAGAASNACAGSPAAISGDAVFAGCTTDACDGSPTNPGKLAITWGSVFINNSTNSASEVVSCTWEWNDAAYGDPNPIWRGKPGDPGNGTTRNPADGACLSGQKIYHDFYPGMPNPTKCYYYSVKLTIYLKNGLTPSWTQNVRQPYGTQAPNCKKP